MSDLTTPELPSVSFVAGLGDEDRLLLGSYGEYLPFQNGQTIIREGDHQEYLYILLKGLAHATRMADDHQVLVGRIHKGESFGEINIFDPGLASATVTAREFTQVWRINRGALGEFMDAYPIAAGNVMIGIATQLSKRLRTVLVYMVELKEKQLDLDTSL